MSYLLCLQGPFPGQAQTRYSATKRELLAVVNFTRHFRHYFLGTQFKIVTDHSALQWLHNFKDPDALIARWLEKLTAFKYEVVHCTGKSIGHADGLSRTPTRALNKVSEQPKTGDQSKTRTSRSEWPNRLSPINYMEKAGDILDSDESGIRCPLRVTGFQNVRRNRSRDKTTIPDEDTPKNLIGKSVLWPQMIHPPQRFVNHLITKKSVTSTSPQTKVSELLF